MYKRIIILLFIYISYGNSQNISVPNVITIYARISCNLASDLATSIGTIPANSFITDLCIKADSTTDDSIYVYIIDYNFPTNIFYSASVLNADSLVCIIPKITVSEFGNLEYYTVRKEDKQVYVFNKSTTGSLLFYITYKLIL